MKITNLLLASTALPFLLLSSPDRATARSVEPFAVAQAGPGAPEELPPGARPRRQQPDDGSRPRDERPGRGQRPELQDGERGPPREERGPRSPRQQGPEQEMQRPPSGMAPPGTRPGETRPRREAPPAERPAPADMAPARPTRPELPPSAAPPAELRRQQAPDSPPPAQRAAPSRPTPPDLAPERRAPPAETPQRATPPQPQGPAETRPARPRPPQPVQPGPTAQPPAPAQAAPSAPAGSRPTATPPAPPSPQFAPQPQAPSGAAPTARQPSGPQPLDAIISGGRIEDLRGQRRQRVEEGGRRIVIEEPGDRTIIREGDRVIIRHDETDRFRRTYRDADMRVERRDGNEVTILRRPDGTEIVTVRDADGNLVRRIRREPAGREVVLIDNWRGSPRRGYFVEDVVRLPPPVVRIPREEYIVEVEDASQDDLVTAFTAPPVERIERAYTLDEIRQSAPLRERMRRVDLDTITFEFGSWSLPEDQVGAMSGIAEALERALAKNPNEIFLVEGHTDAVGSDEDNLTLSDRRAETVAAVLTQRFGVPAENLTTQGYGEQYLKVNTQGPERQNRRATIRRITPLLHGQN